MDAKRRKQHLHATATAATIIGLAIGYWSGARASHAGWLEIAIFVAACIFLPIVVMSRIDAKYKYED